MAKYRVWVMNAKSEARLVADCDTLSEARTAVTPEHRKEYVYILEWAPATTVRVVADVERAEAQRLARPLPTCKYLWGCLCNRAHTNDLRESVRAVLRS